MARNLREIAQGFRDTGHPLLAWNASRLARRAERAGVLEFPGTPEPDRSRFDFSLEGKLAPRITLASGLEKDAIVAGITEGRRQFSSFARDVVARSKKETPIEKGAQIHWGILTVGDLVDSAASRGYVTTDELYEAIRDKEELRELSVLESLEIIAGMENQPMGDVVRMAHEPVAGSDGDPEVLTTGHDDSG